MGWSDQVENEVSQLRSRVNWLAAFVTRSLIGKRVKIAYIMSAFMPGVGGCVGAYRHVAVSDVTATVVNKLEQDGKLLVEFECDGKTFHAWVDLEEITLIEEEGK